jgi:hypothetical protein
LSIKIAQRVAAVTDQEVRELPPLYDTIDSDLLESLFNSAGESSSLEIRFTYAGQRVIIDESEVVRIETS